MYVALILVLTPSSLSLCVACRYLLHKGVRKEVKTTDGERPLDLIDASDLQTIGAMLESDASRVARLEEESTSSLNVADEKSKHSSPHKNSGNGPSGSNQKKKSKKKSQDKSDSSSSSDSS